MSLVAYGSSDESENEEETNDQSQTEIKAEEISIQNINRNSKLQLPTPKTEQINSLNGESGLNSNTKKLNFDMIPKPIPLVINSSKTYDYDIENSDDLPVPTKVNYGTLEKPPTKTKGPVKLFLPSLSDFTDLEEESEEKRPKRKPSEKGSSLVNLLPPPKETLKSAISKSFVPNVLTKKPVETKLPIKAKTAISQNVKSLGKSATRTKPATTTLISLSSYDSDSDDEDNRGASTKMDFFSLSTPTKIPDEILPAMSTVDINAIIAETSLNEPMDISNSLPMESNESNKTLTSNVMNLPKEEIILKNKAEIGPKLPVPEQEYNLDSKGNIAFDEKAIEYLCGKRGVKRKNEFNNVDIVEINGEDIKPDEREWLVKALTEEQAQRPISTGAGPSGQSKKKHQITYLAHQAKAMELELKNQWAQNKASRQQTRSKYGF